MRRPTFCSALDEDDHNIITTPPAPLERESRFSKMKRIITGSILMGRKGKKESIHSLPMRGQLDYAENGSEYYEKDGLVMVHANMKMDEEVKKCKNTKGLQLKSHKQRFDDDNMDTENLSTKNDVPINMGKANGAGKKLKEVNIDIAQNQESATTEIVLNARKRKERLDSEGSITQENKVIRSNSEERPDYCDSKTKDNIRRVSSHEDFSRTQVLKEINSFEPAEIDGVKFKEPTKKKNGFCMEGMFHNAEELEHEKIRSCERFSRAVIPSRGRRNISRKKCKGSKKRLEIGESSQINKDVSYEGAPVDEKALEASERNRSPSPRLSSSPPALDISTLHKQMEGSEPIASRKKVLSPEDDEPESPSLEVLISPRNSLVMRLMNSDPSVPPSPPRDHNMRHRRSDSQERKLTKKINSIKKQLKRYEEGFQEEFGYRPSQADKMANKDIKKMCSDLNSLRTQLKQFREEFADDQSSSASKHINFLTSLENPAHQNSAPSTCKHYKTNKTIEEVFQEVEKRLQEKRQQCGRSSEISEMNRGDLLEEKLAVQKALLYLENVFGRPVTKEDKDLVRPLYQRYSSLKRLVIRNAGTKLNNSTGELATILEHEAMEFTTSPSTSFDLAEGALSAPEDLHFSLAAEPSLLKSQPEDAQNSSSSSDSLGENLHALPLSQLLEQQKKTREEKKKLRRNLKEFEESFQSYAGRKAQKQDRIIIEGIYANYKQLKAKLRLLDALVAKKSCVKRNSC